MFKVRLIKRRLLPTENFKLVACDPHNLPDYAILSHIPGLDEVSLRDIINGGAEKKAGYKKLEFCGQRAALDSLEYFWIDTCCIDTNDSTEVSIIREIRFALYRKARNCYVCLSDVSKTDFDNAGWESRFGSSEWFTHGWTLQELIAPSSVEFFSTEGERLGDRQSLDSQIQQATGIPVEALRGNPLSWFEIDERLSWIDKRRIDPEEDIVYCLSGLFGVRIIPLYGEGRRRALVRLRREIERQHLLPPYTGGHVPWTVPFERNPRFKGQESQLVELGNKLSVGSKTSRIAITGLGGIGKTQLVLEMLYRIRERQKYCSILWIRANSLENLREGYLVTARQLELPECEDQNVDVVELVHDHLSKKKSSFWVLVFDGADDLCRSKSHTSSQIFFEAKTSRVLDACNRSTRESSTVE